MRGPRAQADPLIELARQGYQIDAEDRDRLLRRFHLLGHAARTVPFRRLEYPRCFAALADVHHAIVADLAEAPSWS